MSKYPAIRRCSFKRSYPVGNIASHILGYINSIITPKQYERIKAQGYTMNDIYIWTNKEQKYVF